MAHTSLPNGTATRQSTPSSQQSLQRIGVIYCRVSTKDQAEEGFSLGDQLEYNTQYAATAGIHVPPEYIFSEDYTATTLKRPEFTKVRALLQEPHVTDLILRVQDRLGRSLAQQLLMIEEVERAGVQLHIDGRPLSDKSPEGKLNLHIRGVFAEYELARIKERMEGGRLRRAKEGYPPASRVPLGYRYVKHEKKGGHYDIDPEEAALVREIFTLYVHGAYSLNQLARLLTERGVPHRQRRPGCTVSSWDPGTLHGIIKNETYVGRYYWGKRQGLPGLKNPDKKTRWRKVPKEQQILITVPAILDEGLFAAAQEKLARNAVTSPRNRKYEYLLVGGRLRCGQCGRGMTGFSNRQGSRLYKCTRPPYHDVEPHSKRRVVAPTVESAIWRAVERALNNPRRIAAFLKRRRQGTRTQQGNLDHERQLYTRQLAQCDKDTHRWEAAYLAEAIDVDDFKGKKAEIEVRRASVTRELARLEEEEQHILEATLETVAIEDYCARVRSNLKDFTIQEKRVALEALDVRAVWHPDRPLDLSGGIEVDIVSSTSQTVARPRPLTARWLYTGA